jgi:hypothetical protein
MKNITSDYTFATHYTTIDNLEIAYIKKVKETDDSFYSRFEQ